MHPRTGCAHAHPPAPTLGPLPRATMPPGRPASAQAGATAASRIPRSFVAQRAPSLGVAPLLLPSRLQLQAERRRRPGAGLLLCRPGRRGGRGCCGRSPQPSDGAPPGAGTPRSRSGSGLGPRARGRQPVGKQEALTEEDRPPPARPAAEQSERRGAERAPRLREGTKGAGAGAGARGRGLARRGRARDARPRGCPAAAPSRQWAGGRKTRRNLVS